jgi:sugar lactone lactonase YvrE
LARIFCVRVIACERDPDFHHIVPCCRLKVSIQAKLKRAGAPNGNLSVLAHCEYPNRLALSPDEHIMYVTNTRSSQYIHAIRLDAAGNMVERSIWVIAPDGKRIGIIRWPEQAVNFAFAGRDLRTMLCCAHTSVNTLRVNVPGNPHSWYKLRGQ